MNLIKFSWDRKKNKTHFIVKIDSRYIEFFSNNPESHFKTYNINTFGESNVLSKVNEIENFEFGSTTAKFIKEKNNEIFYGHFGIRLICRFFKKMDPESPLDSFKKIYSTMSKNYSKSHHESISDNENKVQFFEFLINKRKWLNFFSGTSSYDYNYFFYTFIDDWILAFNVYEHGINSPPKELDLETLKIVQNLMVEFLEGVNIYDENDPEVKDLPPPGAYPPAGETIAERDEPLW